MSSSRNRQESNQNITPPSSFTDQPLTPPPTDEKPFAQAPRVTALFDEIRAEKHSNQDPWVEFQLAEGDYDKIAHLLRQDEELRGVVEDKIRYDYDAESHRLVVRMPTAVHELFIARVADAVFSQLKPIREGLDDAAAFAQRVSPARSTEIYFPVENDSSGRKSKHEPNGAYLCSFPTSTMIPKASSSGQTSRVVYESTDTVRKWGAVFRLRRETEAMAFVQKHTSIPIPAVIDVQFPTHEADEPSWILMKRLPGSQMGDSWHAMSKHAQAQALRQLKSYLDQLRRLRPSEPGWIGSCSKGPAYDHRLNNMSICGPFASVSAFNDFLVAPVKHCPRPEWVAKYRSRLRDDHGITFAHADISWENILVDPPTGNITGILDWEMAGYWPEWWEYRKALFGSRSQSWWRDILKEVMQEYPEETETDMELEMF